MDIVEIEVKIWCTLIILWLVGFVIYEVTESYNFGKWFWRFTKLIFFSVVIRVLIGLWIT